MPLSDWETVIGLEVHAQLLTETKLFCGCSAAFGAAPNANTCPVCLAMPGVLPVLNARAVEFAIRAGLALDCQIRPKSVFARKNYFYPDLPKGYQISQYDLPLCEHGKLTIDTAGGELTVRILRIHMEEDAGKNVHDDAGGDSLVDLNRAGVPLIEIVSEPDLRNADDAAEYLRVLRDILVYLGVNDGNLEEGSFRCDANVSVRKKGATALGQRTELKNINSFRFVKQAIEYEVGRQVEVLEAGGRIHMETRLFDPVKGETRSMRSKEEAHDYRYFPEPDLPPLVVLTATVDALRKTLPELPRPKQKRFMEKMGLPLKDARTLVGDRALADYFEAAVAAYKGDAKKMANWCLGELLRLMKEDNVALAGVRIQPPQIAALAALVDGGSVSNTAAKEAFAEMFRTGKDAATVVAEKGLAQVSDTSAVEAAIEKVLAANAGEVEKYRSGKTQVFGFLVGQVMKAMQGKGNPQVVNAVLKKKLEA
ncbi:MAG: Asp-tRNA(Asn)/Glu-tRNA(Gln) amidotransferase subunit GatB [Myxococcaceae bacterium]